ncbi:Ras-related protein Rab-32B [Trichoplax sp. H2]|nr:Ras-related protein Rab-32B [Trichoplax sp. H2]|eukprot:RDD46813.1 Ras-related protein Rab-32B [Trichoplax sp. H2]
MGSGASSKSKNIPDLKVNLKVKVPSFKIVLVGSCEVGKSSIYLRYTKNQFDYSYQPTLSVNIINVTKKLNIPADTLVSLTLWDMPGEEDMQLRRSYYKDLDAAVVVVDLSDKDDVERAEFWKQDIINNTFVSTETNNLGDDMQSKKRAENISDKKIPVILMGNKFDKVEVKLHEGQLGGVPEIVHTLEKIAQDNDFIGSVTVSAKSGDGSVHTAMQSLVRYLIEQNLQDVTEKKRSLMKALANKGKKLQENVKDKKEIPPEQQFQKLAVVGMPEFDDEFEQCNMSMKLLVGISAAFSNSLYNFRAACMTAKAISDIKAPIEECLHGLDTTIGEDNDIEANQDGGLIQLILSESNKGATAEQRKVIKIFNSEVSVAINKITNLCPGINSRLDKRQDEIKELLEKINDLNTAKIMSRKDILRAREVAENNCDRIDTAKKHAEKALKTATTIENKILGSLDW